MTDLITGREDLVLLIYCFILLWVNVSYLREHKKIKESLAEISSEEELDINPHSFSLLLFVMAFSFLRSWLFYILAILITGSLFVIILSAVLFIANVYLILFETSLAKVKKSKVRFYHVIGDTVFIAGFVIYYFALV
ncbi:hypothetical protein [Alkalihalobacterium sp. APHAB7]|uniref:hypothetical protein n=1 Tax=Alkalihalobacterium sp. APHAB7 TaxID=3402081 RepID=UPI003AAD6AA2